MSAGKGPVIVRNAEGAVILSVGSDVLQGDGPERNANLAGQVYETVVFSYMSPQIEDIEDIWIDRVKTEVQRHLQDVIEAPGFYSIEWRVRPLLKVEEASDETAQIKDKLTGEIRQGIEMLYSVSVRWRWLVHSRVETMFDVAQQKAAAK